MYSLFRRLATLWLVLTNACIEAQSFWQPLNGPNGIQKVYDLSPDASGQLFMSLDSKIYRSTDKGNSWIECNKGLSGAVFADKFIQSPSGDFYLSLKNGNGVYRYDPVDDSWLQIPAHLGLWGTYDGFDMDPQGRFWVSASASNSSIFYSTDNGQTYQKVPLNGAISGWFERLATYNDDHNLIAVAFGAQGNLYHFSSNGQVDLVQNFAPSMNFVGYNPKTGTAYYSDTKFIKRSTDGGVTWQDMTLQSGTFQPSLRKLTFEPDGSICAHTNKGLFWSEDDGVTWTKDLLLNIPGGNYFQAGAGDWFVSNDCGAPELGYSSDGGVTWQELSHQFQKPTVFDIKKDASGNIYARTCRQDAYEKSNDGGQTWTNYVVQDSITTNVKSMAVHQNGVTMAIGENGKYYRSLNNGADWEEMINVSLTPGGLYPGSVYCDYQGNFYIIEVFNGVSKSADSGDSWQTIPAFIPTDIHSLAIHPNGDVYFSSGYEPIVFEAKNNIITELESNGEIFNYTDHFHCTAKGLTFFKGFTNISGNGLFRILPDGNYSPELVPFFENFPNIYGITSNVEGDVFVITGNLLFKSEDNGVTWQGIGQIPDNAYVKTFFIAPDQYLYAGYDGDVIYRSAQPTAENNFIFGKVWLDNDGDCQYDAGEAFQSSVAVTATGNGDYTAFSGYSGHFILSAPSGNYALNVQPPNALYEPCQPGASVTLNGPHDSATVNLPLKAVAQCPYLSVSLTTPVLRRCSSITYTVRYKNEGTAVAEDAYVQVTLDSFFIFQSSTLPVAAQNGFTYTFSLGDLAPGQSGSFNIVVQVSCDASLGQTHCISAQIYPNQLCLPALPPLAFYRECRENTGSFDPNDKRAFVEGREDPGSVLPGTDIEYLIRFQNTGTDTAFRVVVEDRFSTLLDLASVTPLVASHPYKMEVKDQRVLRFVFDNILLPDSNINEAASHGFVKFRVSQAPNVPLGSVIRNEADIFFDYNAPVRTNESKLVVGLTAIRPEPGNPYTVIAYPNPFGEAVTFEVEGPALSGPLTLRLFDALGRQVRREEFAGTTFSLERAALETGLFYFLIESEGKRVGAGKVEAK